MSVNIQLYKSINKGSVHKNFGTNGNTIGMLTPAVTHIGLCCGNYDTNTNYHCRKKTECFWVSVCLFVYLSVFLFACFIKIRTNFWTDFDEIFWWSMGGPKTKRLDFGSNPNHNMDPDRDLKMKNGLDFASDLDHDADPDPEIKSFGRGLCCPSPSR